MDKRERVEQLLRILVNHHNFLSSWGIYFFDSDFKNEPELKNKLFTIWIVAILDSIEDSQKIVEESIEWSRNNDQNSVRDFAEEVSQFISYAKDIVDLFSKEEQFFLKNQRDQFLLAWLDKQSNSFEIQYLNNSSIVNKTVGKEEYRKIIRDVHSRYESLDHALKNLRTRFLQTPSYYWFALKQMRQEKFFEDLREDVYSDRDMRLFEHRKQKITLMNTKTGLIEADLDRASINKGNNLTVNIKSDLLTKFNQVQIEIIKPGSLNPEPVFSTSFKIKGVKSNTHELKIETKHLNKSTYEIKLIKFHSPKNEDISDNVTIDLIGGRNFPRLIFEIVSPKEESRSAKTITQDVLTEEKEALEDFHSGLDISSGKDSQEYCIYCQIKGLKIGKRYALSNFAIIPLDKGLDSKDELDATNYFLKNYTSTNLSFEYTQEIASSSQKNKPVSITYFPKIIADSLDDALDIVQQKVENLLKAMSLLRGANGEIFDYVVINLNTGDSKRITPRSSYVGNLLTGSLAGESKKRLNSYVNTLESNYFKKFLVSLHKEALNEENEDFKYLRYWSILEILSENKNYKSTGKLFDFDGNKLIKKIDGEIPSPKSKREQCVESNSVIRNVYRLFKEHEIGNAYDTLKNIKIWYSFRNAVAHFGSVDNWEKLGSSRDYLFAKKGMKTIKNSSGNNSILFELKEDVKLILMRELA